MPTAIRTLALVVNTQKSGAPDLATALLDIAKKNGVSTRVTEIFPVPDGFLKNCDACCVIGGDGTLLGVAADAAREHVPVIGVNRGSLGFLTIFTAEEARAEFADLLAGNFQLSRRSLLQCKISGGAPALTLNALNDIVVEDERSARLVRLEVFANGELVTNLFGDGLIISTPTGSTAYNLSAGGPLIHPGAEVFAMTPICPHTLTNRSIIFRDDARLQIRTPDEQARMHVCADGVETAILNSDASIEVSLSPHNLMLIQRPEHSYFSIVRQKLRWSGSH